MNRLASAAEIAYRVATAPMLVAIILWWVVTSDPRLVLCMLGEDEW